MEISNYTWEIYIVGMLICFGGVLVKKRWVNSSADVISKTERLFLVSGISVCAIAVAILCFNYSYDFSKFIS